MLTVIFNKNVLKVLQTLKTVGVRQNFGCNLVFKLYDMALKKLFSYMSIGCAQCFSHELLSHLKTPIKRKAHGWSLHISTEATH